MSQNSKNRSVVVITAEIHGHIDAMRELFAELDEARKTNVPIVERLVNFVQKCPDWNMSAMACERHEILCDLGIIERKP